MRIKRSELKMITDGVRLVTQGKKRVRILSMFMALVLALTLLPMGTLAAPASITVSGAGNATSVMAGINLQMIHDSQTSVTWSVYDVSAGVAQATQNYASINSTTGLLSGMAPGIVRVTATALDGATGAVDITVWTIPPIVIPPVFPPIIPPTVPVPVSQIGTLVLQGGSEVTLAKTKINGLSGVNTYWATPGQEIAETAPVVGTLAASINNVYNINITANPFVPASVGQTISVIEVNGSDVVVGFGTITVTSDEQIGTNKPPVLKYSEMSVRVGNGQSWSHTGEMFMDPENNGLSINNAVSSNPGVVVAGTIYNEYLLLTGVMTGTASVSFDLWDNTGDKIRYTIDVLAATLQAPNINENYSSPFTIAPVGITFVSSLTNSTWADVISSIEVNGVVIAPENYTVTKEKQFSDMYGEWKAGEILFQAGVLVEGENWILIKANGYVHARIVQDIHKSEQSFYTNPLTINKTSGKITASVKVLDRLGFWETATATFQLMNGDVPVSTISYTVDELDDYQVFQTEFNLVDAATNTNYSVRVFIKSGDNTNNEDLGYNLATELTQQEFDELFLEW
jgi:hypothetical protein